MGRCKLKHRSFLSLSLSLLTYNTTTEAELHRINNDILRNIPVRYILFTINYLFVHHMNISKLISCTLNLFGVTDRIS